MQRLTEVAFQHSRSGVFTRDEAAHWAGGRGARLDALLKRAMAEGEITRAHRGLYCLDDRYTRRKVDPLELAQRIHGPSYISMETALAQHGWIPEGVRSIESASVGRSRTFDTPFGRFGFTSVPKHAFLGGVRRAIGNSEQAFFLATPLTALADLVYSRKLDWSSMEPLVESLRIDEENLEGLGAQDFEETLPCYPPGRARRFLEGLRKELGR